MNKTCTILIVDDNRISRRITSSFLQSLDVSLLVAIDGFEAIELIEETSVDAVFMNLYLPTMSGYETTEKIRKLPKNNDVPIVAITSIEMDEMTDEMVASGFTDVLTKPFNKETVLGLLNSFSKDSTPVFDYNKYINTYKDVELQKDIVETFLSEEESDTERILNAFKANKADEIYSAIHYMKGSFSYLKAMKILIVTQKMLDHIKQGDLDKALVYKNDFISQYKELVEELKNYTF